MIKTLARMVGGFEVVDPPSDDFTGNFYAAKVMIDLGK
jgi:hypothetical protein